MKDKQQFTLVKIPIKVIIDNKYDVNLSKEEEKEYLIEQGMSLLFNQIERIRGKFSKRINELILIEAPKNKNTENELRYILNNDFKYNGRKYLRFGKSASQAKAGITAFVDESIYQELYMITQMDIKIDLCVISKYESQRCLPFSSCTLVKDFFPRVCIIDEYEKILPNQLIRYVQEVDEEYIDKDTGESKSYKARKIMEGYKDIKISPFDGCGCHEQEFAEITSKALGLDYTAIGNQVRIPFVKGYSVYVPFRKILSSWGVTEIRDVYGKLHNIDDIDCIWNTSMFKGHKIFKNEYGNDAWDKYIETINKYKFQIGISKYSHHLKHLNMMSKLNFQYIQCLDLWNQKYIDSFIKDEFGNYPKYDILAYENRGKIIDIAKYTTNLYEKIIKGDKFCTYKFLGINDTEGYESESNYIKAVLINDIMLKDPSIKQFIHRKLKKSINEAKFGKIYAEGFYHTVVGDMIGYLEYACGKEVKGCLNAKEFYCKTLRLGKAVSFRSPLVCPSEVNSINLVDNEILQKWFGYFQNQDVVMLNMYDLSFPQQGGMDADGDAVFLCTNQTIIDSKINKPIVIDIEDKVMTKEKAYTKENITDYELNSRDNRIGEITNVATSIENKYTTDLDTKKKYEDFSSLLRILQGKEIDYLKTGIRWQMNKGLRQHLKQLPYFLLYVYPKKMKTYEKIRTKNKLIENKENKIKPNAYKSPSPMNELCEYINAWEKKHIIWDRTIVDTKCLILNNELKLEDRKIQKDIRHLINEYADKMKKIISEEKTEDDYNKSNLLLEEYKEKLSCIIPNDEELLANYVIKVSYSNMSINKGLAWSGYGEYILKNLSDNTPSRKNTSILESPYVTDYEYLGKYYEFKDGYKNE